MPRRPGSIDVSQIDFQEAVSQNVTFSGSVTAAAAVYVSQYIYHHGDNNTLINFADDKIIFKAGNKAMITVEEKNSAPHEVTINDGSNNIDFVVKGNGSNQGNPGMKFDASENRLGINGVGSPSWELDVAGDIGIAEYIYHRTDTDTYIRFEDDEVTINAGGRSFINLQEASTDKLVINNGGLDIDLQVKGENYANLIRTDAANDRVGIGISTPDTRLHVSGKLKTVSATENVNKKAISLDGTNDHVLVSDQDDFSFTDGSSDVAFSLSAWVYIGDVSADDGPFIAKANFSTGNTEFIFKHANGVLQFFLYDRDQSASGHQIRTLANSATLSDTTWHHVVATYSGNGSHTGLKIYTDGSQTTATQSTLTGYTRIRNTSTPLTLGATEDLANANRVFEDRLADCVVFNKELSSSEVTELYNSGKVMNIRNHSAFANVVSWWKMGDDEDIEGSSGIKDYVSGYHGTLTNGAAIIDQTEISSSALNSLSTNASGSLGIGIESPDETLHVYGSTKLEGPLILKERTYDPDNPAEGSSVIWMSNGHGSGDDGDILIKITAGGVTKTVTLVDFSAS